MSDFNEFWGLQENPDVSSRTRRRGDGGRQWVPGQRDWTPQQVQELCAWASQRDSNLESRYFRLRFHFDALVLQMARESETVTPDPISRDAYAAAYWALRQIEHERRLLARLVYVEALLGTDCEHDLPQGDPVILDFFEMFLRETGRDRRQSLRLA